jgi:cob(I)alamin adenosyltransferase
MRMCSFAQHKAPVAIRTFDVILVTHFQEDAGMAERAPAAVAGDSGGVHFDDFRSFDRHESIPLQERRIIITGAHTATIGLARRGRAYSLGAMVVLNRIYTKTGDKGETALGDGTRLPKHDLRVASYGTVDEANAAIGLARLHARGEIDAMLARIQNDLFDLGADLCVPEGSRRSEGALRIIDSQVERLEHEIDAMNAELSPLKSFVLPGGTPVAAHLHLARAVARRAERLMVELAAREPVGAPALKYVNRLSDHLFVASRYANDKGARDVLWTPGANR